MLSLSLVLVMIVCTILIIRTERLLVTALWLAAMSAAVAALLYELGAHELAVIELSVGTGLVPVLFVFAASLMGKSSALLPLIVPRWLALGLALLLLLLAAIALPGVPSGTQPPLSTSGSFGSALWDERGLDMLVQIGLVFAGILSILHLLAPNRRPTPLPQDEPVPLEEAEPEREAV